MDKFEKRLIERVRHTAGKSIGQYNMIEDGDHILIGVSGGKDSLILLETLAARRIYVPIDYKLTAVHVKVKDISYEIDRQWLQSFCDEWEVPFIYQEVDYEKTDEQKTACFFCSWTRRKELFRLSRELNCNKIATGHHMDDALETLLLNMVYHGSISSMPGCFSMFDGRIQFIRPLIEIQEERLVEYAKIRKYPQLKSECPHDSETKRKTMRTVIEQLNQIHSQAKINMFRSMSKICDEYLPKVSK